MNIASPESLGTLPFIFPESHHFDDAQTVIQGWRQTVDEVLQLLELEVRGYVKILRVLHDQVERYKNQTEKAGVWHVRPGTEKSEANFHKWTDCACEYHLSTIAEMYMKIKFRPCTVLSCMINWKGIVRTFKLIPTCYVPPPEATNQSLLRVVNYKRKSRYNSLYTRIYRNLVGSLNNS